MRTAWIFVGALVAAGAVLAAPPTINSINDDIPGISPLRVVQTETLSVTVTATDPEGAPSLSASGLPAGASFVDDNNPTQDSMGVWSNTGTFTWTPSQNQLGTFGFTVMAQQAGDQVNRSATVVVAGYPLSHGFYRVGYMGNTTVEVRNDHLTHSPRLKIDLRGDPVSTPAASCGGITNPYAVVAGAGGQVRCAIDDNTECGSGCSEFNNRVRIRHPNCEWTKYTHFTTDSVADAGITLDQQVSTATYLGDEGDVGASSGSGHLMSDCSCGQSTPPPEDSRCGIHLHFEVRADGPLSELRVPLLCSSNCCFNNGSPGCADTNCQDDVCDVDPFCCNTSWDGICVGEAEDLCGTLCNNIYDDGEIVTSGSCSSSGCEGNFDLDDETFNARQIKVFQAADTITAGGEPGFRVEGSSSVALVAGDSIRLLPGFRAGKYSYFHAWIGNCNGRPAQPQGNCPTFSDTDACDQ